MSKIVIVKATCSECKKKFPLEIWQSVNIQIKPKMYSTRIFKDEIIR